MAKGSRPVIANSLSRPFSDIASSRARRDGSKGSRRAWMSHARGSSAPWGALTPSVGGIEPRSLRYPINSGARACGASRATAFYAEGAEDAEVFLRVLCASALKAVEFHTV